MSQHRLHLMTQHSAQAIRHTIKRLAPSVIVATLIIALGYMIITGSTGFIRTASSTIMWIAMAVVAVFAISNAK